MPSNPRGAIRLTVLGDLLTRSLPPPRFFLQLARTAALKHRNDVGFHYQNLERGALLYSLVRDRHVSRALELGTGRGYGSLSMAAALRDHGRRGRVTTIDILDLRRPQRTCFVDEDGTPRWGVLPVAALFARCDIDLTRRIELLTGDSQLVARRLIASRRQYDLVYVDGNHRYTGVLFDVVAALRLVRPGGTMVLDDHALPGVRRLVGDLARTPVGTIHLVRTDGAMPALGTTGRAPDPQQGMVVFIAGDPEAILRALPKRTRLNFFYASLGPARRGVAEVRRLARGRPLPVLTHIGRHAPP